MVGKHPTILFLRYFFNKKLGTLLLYYYAGCQSHTLFSGNFIRSTGAPTLALNAPL